MRSRLETLKHRRASLDYVQVVAEWIHFDVLLPMETGRFRYLTAPIAWLLTPFVLLYLALIWLVVAVARRAFRFLP